MTAHTKRGVTLLEMLVVLAVLGILLAIGALNLSRAAEQRRLDEAARTVGETLRRVGDDASKKSQRITLSLSADNTTLSWEDEEDVVRSQSLPEGATVTIGQLGLEGGSGSTDIVFLGRGFPVQGRTFTVTRNGENRVVNLLATGTVVYR